MNVVGFLHCNPWPCLMLELRTFAPPLLSIHPYLVFFWTLHRRFQCWIGALRAGLMTHRYTHCEQTPKVSLRASTLQSNSEKRFGSSVLSVGASYCPSPFLLQSPPAPIKIFSFLLTGDRGGADILHALYNARGMKVALAPGSVQKFCYWSARNWRWDEGDQVITHVFQDQLLRVKRKFVDHCMANDPDERKKYTEFRSNAQMNNIVTTSKRLFCNAGFVAGLNQDLDIFPLENGILDIPTATLCPHHPHYMISLIHDKLDWPDTGLLTPLTDFEPFIYEVIGKNVKYFQVLMG
jgi:hypothetical protein